MISCSFLKYCRQKWGTKFNNLIIFIIKCNNESLSILGFSKYEAEYF